MNKPTHKCLGDCDTRLNAHAGEVDIEPVPKNELPEKWKSKHGKILREICKFCGGDVEELSS